MSEKWLYILHFDFPTNLPFWISQTFIWNPKLYQNRCFFYHFLLLYNVFLKIKPFYSSTLYFIYLFIFAFRFPCVKNIKTNFRFFSKDLFICILYTVVFILVYSHQGRNVCCATEGPKKICFFFLLIRFPKLTKILQVNYIFFWNR